MSEIVGDIGFIPVGSVDLKYMGPMDFEEFLWAMGFSSAQTETIRKHVSDMEPFETFVLRQLNDLFKRFLVIGGMPASVSAYARTHMYTDSYNEQEYILKLLSMDIEKYISNQTDKIRINQCLESIPRQLSRERNASFLYSDVLIKSKYGQREYGPAIKWLDGAGVIDTFKNVTVPMLSPTIFFVIIITAISSFQVFDLIYLMTQGGPLDSTNVLVYAIYKNAFEYFNIGKASAIAYVLFVIILVLTLFQWKFRKKIVYNEE